MPWTCCMATFLLSFCSETVKKSRIIKTGWPPQFGGKNETYLSFLALSAENHLILYKTRSAFAKQESTLTRSEYLFKIILILFLSVPIKFCVKYIHRTARAWCVWSLDVPLWFWGEKSQPQSIQGQCYSQARVVSARNFALAMHSSRISDNFSHIDFIHAITGKFFCNTISI